jgi:hypothetical protein
LQTRNVKDIACMSNIWIILPLQWTSWIRILSENLIGLQEVMKFPDFIIYFGLRPSVPFNKYSILIQASPMLFSLRKWQRHSVRRIRHLKQVIFSRSTVTICTTRFSIQKFHVPPTQCIYVFCVDLRTNSDYFPIQHQLTGFYGRDGECLLRGTDWIFVYNSLYSINWLVFRRVGRKASPCLSVCLSVSMKQLGFDWTDFHEIWVLFENLPKHSSFIKIWQEQRVFYINTNVNLPIIARSILRIRNISDKSCKENQNTFSVR